MREVISVHVGQAGVQIGNACCKSHSPFPAHPDVESGKATSKTRRYVFCARLASFRVHCCRRVLIIVR